MVLPILLLPAELQALFVLVLADERTAGRLAQASHECKQLLPQQCLVQIREAHRLAEKAQMEARRQRKRAVVLELFEAVDGGPFHVCKANAMTGGTPCGKRLHVARSGSLQVLMRHLASFHSAEYSALMLTLEQI